MKTDIDFKETYSSWKDTLEVPGKPTEWEVKELMRSIGLPVPEEFLVRAEDPISGNPNLRFTLDTIAKPFAVKLCSAEVLHKTDVGGVLLDIPVDELSEVLQDLRNRFPGEHLLVSPMVPIRGPEFILGALADPVFGPAVMAGAGGILTEIYKDVTFRLAPSGIREAGRMLEELTIAPVLEGYRGSSMDLEGLKTIISRFSRLAAVATAEGAELDINPLVWTGSEWLVLDAKAVL